MQSISQKLETKLEHIQVKLGEGETAETAPLGGESPEALEAKIKALEKEKEALGEGVVMVYTTGDGDERKVTKDTSE